VSSLYLGRLVNLGRLFEKLEQAGEHLVEPEKVEEA